MSVSSHPNLALPKPMGPRLTKAEDARELARCRARSGGRCEMRIQHQKGRVRTWGRPDPTKVGRCHNRATQNHHLLGGHGVRGRGISGLAEWRLDICDFCHHDIDGTIGGPRLVPIPATLKGDNPAATAIYTRRR